MADPKPLVDITDPEEPVSLAEARAHLNLTPDVDSDAVETHPDDAQIAAFITAAREWIEFATGCTIARRHVEFRCDEFPEDGEPLELPIFPAVSLISLDYTPYGEAASSSSDSPEWCELDIYSMPARILLLTPANGWPATAEMANAVRVTVDVGFRAADAQESDDVRPLPRTLRSAILLLMAHLYENREASVEKALSEIPLGVEVLMRTWRYRTGLA